MRTDKREWGGGSIGAPVHLPRQGVSPARVAVRVFAAGDHVAGARHRVAVFVKAGREMGHRRVAMFFATRDGVALQQADGVVVGNVVEVRGQLLRDLPTRIEHTSMNNVVHRMKFGLGWHAYRNVIFAALGAVHGLRELACVGNHVVVHEAHVRVAAEAFEHVGDRLGPRIVARADALRAGLYLAMPVAFQYVEAAFGLGHGGIVEHDRPEHLVGAVRPVETHPFLKFVDSGPSCAVGERRTPKRPGVFGVAPRGPVLGHESDELARFGRVHVVLRKKRTHALV